MKTRSLLQLYSGPSGTPGKHGFRLTGRAKEGDGLCRVQLRLMEPWHRYPDPRLRSTTWDLRVYHRSDAAFALDTQLTADDLDALTETYEFPDGAEELAGLETNGDVVHDRVLAWARAATGAPELSVSSDKNPAELPVRYQKSEAAKVEIPRIPVGRPQPPGQSALLLNAERGSIEGVPLKRAVTAEKTRSAGPPKRPAAKPSEAAPAASSAGASSTAAPSAGASAAAGAPPASKPATPPARPSAKPPAPASAARTKPVVPKAGAKSQSLTERLSAIRDQAGKDASSAPSATKEDESES